MKQFAPPSTDRLNSKVVERPKLPLKLARCFLCLSLLFTSTFTPAVQPVQANGIDAGISKAIPLAGFLIGWSHRNRVYRQSNRFIGERRAYYDKLRETARAQMLDRDLRGLRRSQAAAYVKVVALIEQERTTVFQVAENRKREARRAFHERVQDTLLFAISGSRLAQQLFRSMQTGIGNARQLLDNALSALTSGQSDVLQDINRIKRFAQQVSVVSGALGGRTGKRLQTFSDRLVRAIDRPQEQLREGLEKAQQELQGLSDSVDQMSRVGRVPSAGAAVDQVTARFLPGGNQTGDPSLEAVATILSQLKVGDGSLKDEARNAIRAGYVARCSALTQAYQAQLAAMRSNQPASPDSSGSSCKDFDELYAELENDDGFSARATQAAGGQPSNADEPTAEPTATEQPPIVTASGAFSEPCNRGECPVYGAQFTLTANFAEGVISGTVSGGAESDNAEDQCGNPEDGTVYDSRLLTTSLGYTTSFSGPLSEEGTFSIPVSLAGSYSDKVTRPFTDERCLEYNQIPPDSGSWQENGTVSGYVSRDGSIEFNTRWGSSAIFQGSWSGSGTVSTP